MKYKGIRYLVYASWDATKHPEWEKEFPYGFLGAVDNFDHAVTICSSASIVADSTWIVAEKTYTEKEMVWESK